MGYYNSLSDFLSGRNVPVAGIPDASNRASDASDRPVAGIPDASDRPVAGIPDASDHASDASNQKSVRHVVAGRARFASMSADERRELGRRAARARWRKNRKIGYDFQHD